MIAMVTLPVVETTGVLVQMKTLNTTLEAMFVKTVSVSLLDITELNSTAKYTTDKQCAGDLGYDTDSSSIYLCSEEEAQYHSVDKILCDQ